MSPFTEKIETAFKKLERREQVHTFLRLKSMVKEFEKTLPVAPVVRTSKKSFVTKWAGRFTTPKAKQRDLRMLALKRKYGLNTQ